MYSTTTEYREILSEQMSKYPEYNSDKVRLMPSLCIPYVEGDADVIDLLQCCGNWAACDDWANHNKCDSCGGKMV